MNKRIAIDKLFSLCLFMQNKIKYISDVFKRLAYGINARSIVWNLILDEDDKDSTTMEDIRDLHHLDLRYNESDNILVIYFHEETGGIMTNYIIDENQKIDDLYDKLHTFKFISKEDALKDWTLYRFDCNYGDVAYLHGMFLTTKEFINKFKECINTDGQVYLGEVVGDNSDFDDEFFFDELEEVTSDPAQIQFFIDNIAKDLSFGFIPFEHIKNISCENLEFETPRYI